MGDARAFGGTVTIDESVRGDLVAFGYAVESSGTVGGSVFLGGVNVSLIGGATGPVTIYGNSVRLSGDFADDVTIYSSGRITLAASTTIQGKLSYESPEPANIPHSVTVSGGVKYTSASYLPNIGTSRILALINMGFFIFVRLLGALLLAGLLAGLFPRLADALVEHASHARVRNILLTMLLGFAIMVATPILLILLLLTFVGIGLAVFLLVTYVMLIICAFLYAGILIGGLFARSYIHRDTVLWRDGVIGMLLLSLLTLVPFIGAVIIFAAVTFTAGALLQIFFSFAFPSESRTIEMV